MLPIAAAVLVLLLASRQRERAFAWALAVGGVMAVTLALKYTLIGCRPPSPLAVLHSPSGHTAMATVVYGGLPALLDAGTAATVLLPMTVAVVIGTSRVLLSAHSPPEAILGGGVGLAGAAALIAPRLPAPDRATVIRVLATVGALACLLHGMHASAEGVIRRTAPWFWPFCACTQSVQRNSWRFDNSRLYKTDIARDHSFGAIAPLFGSSS